MARTLKYVRILENWLIVLGLVFIPLLAGNLLIFFLDWMTR